MRDGFIQNNMSNFAAHEDIFDVQLDSLVSI